MSIHLWTNCWWMFACGLAFCEAVLVLSTADRWTTTINPRVYGIGNFPVSLATLIARLWLRGRNVRLGGLWLLLLSCSGELVLVWIPQKSVWKQLVVSPCSHWPLNVHTNEHACLHTPQTLMRGKDKANEIVAAVCFHFCLFYRHYGPCPTSVLFMAFSGELLELLEWLSSGHAMPLPRDWKTRIGKKFTWKDKTHSEFSLRRKLCTWLHCLTLFMDCLWKLT